MMDHCLWIELGSEELPASYIDSALKHFQKLIVDCLREERLLKPEESQAIEQNVQAFSGPRRLSLFIPGVLQKQLAQKEEVFGPPLKAAKDAQGQWSRAAVGFAQKNGLKPEQLELRKDPKGVEKLFAEHCLPEEELQQVLQKHLPSLITQIKFPKSMRFIGQSAFRYARPLRYVSLLWGSQQISIELEGIPCCQHTIGHRILSGDQTITIEQADPQIYRQKLEEHSVLADAADRKQKVISLIKEKVNDVCSDPDWSKILDESLLDEVTNLVEMPLAILGQFEQEYLELPDIVPVTSMKKHQKYFPIIDQKKGLLPHFVAIINGAGDEQLVQCGLERVLRARLADAVFFWQEDNKQPLVDRYEELRSVVYQKDIGSYFEKTESTRQLAAKLCSLLDLPKQSQDNADRAVMLSKIDLISNMVYEFPELQGLMGSEYAKASGENAEVAMALSEQYELGASDSLVSNVCKVSERVDTLLSAFAIGTKVSGSSDPYGLRRAAFSLISILDDAKMDFNLWQLPLENQQETLGRLKPFIVERLRSYLIDKRQLRYDCCDALLADSEHRLSVYEVCRKATCLDQMVKGNSAFQTAMALAVRVGNILEQAKSKGISAQTFHESLLKEDAEHKLYEAYRSALEHIEFKAQSDKEVLEGLANLGPSMDNFFEQILVMDEDTELRGNRLGLLLMCLNLFKTFGDLSKIVVS